ncbi:hypothetical protein NQ317_002385 [Molorchus minor]|uniref:C2H2-type domain-containing protein n=1 Tax=Molorchus minor TaxID=1323400 RepID=A0ABQ9IPJ2_9CUCU|nr:hypothetical protein NQ317_002385 [Molorchus minor]
MYKRVNIRLYIKGTLKNIFWFIKKILVMEMHTCETCNFETKLKCSLKRHLLVHREILKTKHKTNLQTHLLVHKENSEVETYECETCHYKTKCKGDLKQHRLVHRENSEVKIQNVKMLLRNIFWSIDKLLKRCIHVKHVILRQNIKRILQPIF